MVWLSVPVNVPISVAASSSSMMSKLSPLAPTSVNNSTVVPAGDCKDTSRLLRHVWEIVKPTFKSLIEISCGTLICIVVGAPQPLSGIAWLGVISVVNVAVGAKLTLALDGLPADSVM